MKCKLYTKSHSVALLREVDNEGKIFSAQEHGYVTRSESADIFGTRESLLYHWFLENATKLPALAFLMKYINENGFANIISLGAGHCVLEYLLKHAIAKDCKVIAADFDSFFIEKAKLHFSPYIVPVEFDFFQDDVGDLARRLNVGFDLAIFFGSSYVMDDLQFTIMFRRLREIGVQQVIHFPRRLYPLWTGSCGYLWKPQNICGHRARENRNQAPWFDLEGEIARLR